MINKAASCVRLSNPLLINLSAGASACLWLYFLMSDQPLMTTPLPPTPTTQGGYRFMREANMERKCFLQTDGLDKALLRPTSYCLKPPVLPPRLRLYGSGTVAPAAPAGHPSTRRGRPVTVTERSPVV